MLPELGRKSRGDIADSLILAELKLATWINLKQDDIARKKKKYTFLDR